MLSLTGMPPLVGFIGKLWLFQTALAEGLVTLVVIACFNSVVSAAYYLGIVRTMYFEEAATAVGLRKATARTGTIRIVSIAGLDRSACGVLEVTGRDRASFLHALLSNEVKALAPGQGCAATLLDIHGKVQVMLFVWVLDDRILLVTPPDTAASTLEALDIDSLRLIEIFFSIEEAFGITVAAEQAEIRARVRTLGDLARYVEELVAAKAGPVG